MWNKLKTWGCYLLILILLPYILTVFLHGSGVANATNVDEREVKVQTEGEDEAVTMPLSEYGVGIMAQAIPADYEEETLKAQAVLVRTEIFREFAENGSDQTLDLDYWTREEMEQAWGAGDYSGNLRRLERAWEETAGEVLMKDQEVASAPYCSLTNGSTRDGSEVLGEAYAYLKSVDCAEDLKAQEQLQTVTIDDIDAEVTSSDSCGYVLKVRVGEKEISGEQFRSEHQLASSCFTLQKFNGKLRITTRGEGHGLGMSQYTANARAKKGETYREILTYFFEELTLEEAADMVEK